MSQPSKLIRGATTKRLIVFAAVIGALFACVTGGIYLSHAQPAVPTDGNYYRPAPFPVYVTTKAIAAHTRIDGSALELKAIDSKTAPLDAVKDPATAIGKITRAPMKAGEIIRESNLITEATKSKTEAKTK